MTTTLANSAPATAWALGLLHTINRRPGSAGPLHSITGRGVILALAALADHDLNSPAGYRGSTPRELARLVGMAPTTARSWLIALEDLDVVTRSPSGAVWRITEDAFA